MGTVIMGIMTLVFRPNTIISGVNCVVGGKCHYTLITTVLGGIFFFFFFIERCLWLFLLKRIEQKSTNLSRPLDS